MAGARTEGERSARSYYSMVLARAVGDTWGLLRQHIVWDTVVLVVTVIFVFALGAKGQKVSTALLPLLVLGIVVFAAMLVNVVLAPVRLWRERSTDAGAMEVTAIKIGPPAAPGRERLVAFNCAGAGPREIPTQGRPVALRLLTPRVKDAIRADQLPFTITRRWRRWQTVMTVKAFTDEGFAIDDERRTGECEAEVYYK